MIVFDLDCLNDRHRFEGWFKSSDDFAQQQARGLVKCPFCGSSEVVKAVQAPRLSRKANQMPAPVAPSPKREVTVPAVAGPLPPQVVELAQKLAQMQTEALRSSRWVGGSFAEDARAMHYGEREAEVIHGQATIAEAQDLIDEGIAVLPLPFPVTPPEQTN